ncbi:MAG: GNAT family N-acetyltransferase [Methanobrevibacter sp.]|uniref:GNAT family N-acetyltransferase n=1 Tax=Methanobrevibacter sp. TaxID=66852 RepID=UPI001B20D777|nr:N-acetyltransferase [Methanobrevibacter sp.]MBO5150751.1 GNAT family N-acetyltransferase [Methanobrevibacter sp.]
MEILFRKATLDDVEEIVNLCNECFNENTSIDYATRVFKETMNDKNQIYLIGVADNKIVAHTKITVIPTIYEKMNTYSILNHVCVKPEYRRHNIATKMLIECEKISKENNCVVMELWSNNFRQPAHECYKSYGFVVNDAKFFSKEII